MQYRIKFIAKHSFFRSGESPSTPVLDRIKACFIKVADKHHQEQTEAITFIFDLFWTCICFLMSFVDSTTPLDLKPIKLFRATLMTAAILYLRQTCLYNEDFFRPSPGTYKINYVYCVTNKKLLKLNLILVSRLWWHYVPLSVWFSPKMLKQKIN